MSSLDGLDRLVRSTRQVEGVGAYKVGLTLVLSHGLPRVIDAIRSQSQLPVIYDHQKAANDIPLLGTAFAGVCRRAHVDAVILFPLAGPITERAWIRACQDEGLRAIVGGFMTHDGFSTDEGGFIAEADALRIYVIAAECGVRDFVVPATRPDVSRVICETLRKVAGQFSLYSPGFVSQGGEVERFRDAVGDSPWHAIIGSALLAAPDMERAATDLVRGLRGS